MAWLVTCNTGSQRFIKSQVQKLVILIQQYRWIIDAYVSDFYSFQYWEQMPRCLQEYFDTVEPPDLAWMLETSKQDKIPHSNRTNVPLSLLALQVCIKILSLQRMAVDLDSADTRALISAILAPGTRAHQTTSPLAQGKTTLQTSAHVTPTYKNGQCLDMQHVFRNHVKPKKQHEIDKLGQVVSLLCHKTSCKNVVDVGAGLGHLSRLLTFQYRLKATTVEATDGHAPKAAALDRKLKKDVHKAQMKQIKMSQTKPCKSVVSQGLFNSSQSQTFMKPSTDSQSTSLQNKFREDVESVKSVLTLTNFADNTSNSCQTSEDTHCATQLSEDTHCIETEYNLPSHVICQVQPDISSNQFLDILGQENRKDARSRDKTSSKFVLVGLHACGDLTPTLLRVFINCPDAVGMASVACCYMKMSSPNAKRGFSNYPMSTYVQSLQHHDLSYQAREMACHFADAYCQRLKENSPHLKIHSYRASLQVLVTTLKPEFQSGQVRLVSKKGAIGAFADYVTETLKKLNMDADKVPANLLRHCEGLTKHWRRVVAFYTFRLSLAPLVESLLLLDRTLFLLQHEIPSVLIPIFDANRSPRNFVLLAAKGQ